MTFPNTVTSVDRGYPGDHAGGIFYDTLGRIINDTAGVTVGRFAYYVPGNHQQVQSKNTTPSAPILTSGAITNVVADFVALSSPSLKITVDGIDFTASPVFTGNTTFAQIATSMQTALLTAMTGYGHTGLTVTTTTVGGNKFVINTGNLGTSHTISLAGDNGALAVMAKLTPATGAVVTPASVGADLAGLAVRDQSNIVTDTTDILYGQGYSMTALNGQTIPIAEQGRFFVQVMAILGSAAINFGAKVYSRQSDGAVVLGVTTETGYDDTGFTVFDDAALNVANGIIRITSTRTTGAK